MWIQAVKYENEIVNVGAEAAGCPLIVIPLFFLSITMLIWGGINNFPFFKSLTFSAFLQAVI